MLKFVVCVHFEIDVEERADTFLLYLRKNHANPGESPKSIPEIKALYLALQNILTGLQMNFDSAILKNCVRSEAQKQLLGLFKSMMVSACNLEYVMNSKNPWPHSI